MKALTIIQPWAAFIMAGLKDIENRSWPTKYRGPLAIHAGKKKDLDQHEAAAFTAERASGWRYKNDDDRKAISRYCKYGVVLGSVLLVDCVRNHSSVWAVRDSWHWVLSAPIALENPIVVRGHLGLFDVDVTRPADGL